MKLPRMQAISEILDTKYFRRAYSNRGVVCLWQEGISGLLKLKLLVFAEIKKNTSLLNVFTHAGSLFASAGTANAERTFHKYAFKLLHFAQKVVFCFGQVNLSKKVFT